MKVLVVEDDEVVAAALERGLTAEGYTVEVAHDGRSGLLAGLTDTHDLILLDLMLPGRNGFKVCAELRAAGVWTPILVLTAKDGELDEAEALDTGADDFLSKPFAYPVLVARVRALLRRSATAAPAPVDVGDLHLEPAARQVSVGGEPVALTAREFDILELLVRRAGQVVPKDDVLAGIWDAEDDRDRNIVEVYVARLRRKLDRPRAASRIETVRGVGYRLVARG